MILLLIIINIIINFVHVQMYRTNDYKATTEILQ